MNLQLHRTRKHDEVAATKPSGHNAFSLWFSLATLHRNAARQSVSVFFAQRQPRVRLLLFSFYFEMLLLLSVQRPDVTLFFISVFCCLYFPFRRMQRRLITGARSAGACRSLYFIAAARARRKCARD